MLFSGCDNIVLEYIGYCAITIFRPFAHYDDKNSNVLTVFENSQVYKYSNKFSWDLHQKKQVGLIPTMTGRLQWVLIPN
jgi:hypothetical protein